MFENENLEEKMEGTFIEELDEEELEEVAGGKHSYICADEKLNLRYGPGKEYGVICAIPAGDSARYTHKSAKDSRGVKWYKVKYSGMEGWVSSRLSHKERF